MATKNLIQRLIIAVLIFVTGSLDGMIYCSVHVPFLFQEETKWAKYFARGEEFSVLLPETPSLALKLRPGKKASSRYQGRIYAAYGDGIVYVIISENNPKRAEKLETFREEFRKTLPRWVSGGQEHSSEMRFDRDINLNGVSGERYRIKIYGRAEGIVDFYITNQHVYIVEVVGSNENNPSIQHEHAPQARMCFNTNPNDTVEAVQRWA